MRIFGLSFRAAVLAVAVAIAGLPASAQDRDPFTGQALPAPATAPPPQQATPSAEFEGSGDTRSRRRGKRWRRGSAIENFGERETISTRSRRRGGRVARAARGSRSLRARVAPVAASPAERAATEEAEKVNSGTVGVISGGISGTYVRIAADLASVLDDGEQLRVLPILGKGSPQNLRDLLYLEGVDLALVQSDTFEIIRRRRAMRELDGQVTYIARLFNEEMHVLARGDVADLASLANQKVNIDLAGSGTAATAAIVFDRLRIPIQATNFDQVVAYEKLKAGEIAAAVFVGGRPLRGIADFKAEGAFKLLPVPYDRRLEDIYLPATLATADYPNLVPANQQVETVAVGTLLVAFDWPEGSARYKKLEHFVGAFFSRFDEFLRPPRHPKWQETNLAATVPGLERFAPAQQWLDRQTTAGVAAQQGRRR